MHVSIGMFREACFDKHGSIGMFRYMHVSICMLRGMYAEEACYDRGGSFWPLRFLDDEGL